MRRVTRRKHGELIIHQWWVNALLALGLFSITAFLWLWLTDVWSYILGAISLGFFVNRAFEAVRVSRQ